MYDILKTKHNIITKYIKRILSNILGGAKKSSRV